MSPFNTSWTNTFTSCSNQWTLDVLSHEYTEAPFTGSQSLVSFILNSSFLNHHLALDHLTKLSFLDTVIVQTGSRLSYLNGQALYTALSNDMILQATTLYLPLSSLLHFEYQDSVTTMALLTPELSTMLNDFILKHVSSSTFSSIPVSTIDSFIDTWVECVGENLGKYVTFLYFVFVLVCFLMANLPLRWSNPLNFGWLRLQNYLFSASKEVRIQFEAVLQTVVFFGTYWAMVLMAFDDSQEEVIEFVDGGFFYFFVLITLFLVFKYSVHYFAFIEASVAEGRSVAFVAKQVFKDALNTLSLVLRFYILLLRVNVYDTLDDFLDSYYIFVGDFDEDEYLNELFLSIYSSLLFLSENDYDTSFLLEDEHDFTNDWFYIYFLAWGKLFYFSFFMLEEAARLSLAFYVCYLIIFEVHSVNCSFNEGNFFVSKRLSA